VLLLLSFYIILDYLLLCFHSLLCCAHTVSRKLQSVQNTTEWLIAGTRRQDHITLVLRKLHWLPSESMSTSKWHAWFTTRCPGMHLFTWQMTAASCLIAFKRCLWSADVQTCIVPRTYGSYGNRAFAAAGPRWWNFFPVWLCNPDITCGLFRWLQKTHLFDEAWTQRPLTSICGALEKHLLTYKCVLVSLECSVAVWHLLLQNEGTNCQYCGTTCFVGVSATNVILAQTDPFTFDRFMLKSG